MSSSAMELSILKLTSPRKRLGQSARFTFDADLAQPFGTSNITSPKGKGSPLWTDSNRMMVDDELFTIFEQHRAAIPFKWEAIPGTRRDQKVTGVESQSSKDGMSDSEQEDSSASSPTFSLSPSSSTSSSTSSSVSRQEELALVVAQVPALEFQASSICPSSFTTPTKDNASVRSVRTFSDSRKLVDDAGSKGKVLALKPPPGMHSIKQLLTLESDDRNIVPFCFNSRSVSGINSSSISKSSAITSVKSHHGRSFRKDGIKALPFLSSPKEHAEESPTTVLGFEEWSKVVQQQEKQEKQEQQETAVPKSSHHRTMSMPRLAFSFRKKPLAEKENGSDIVDADSFFNEDFGMKGGLRERSALSSMSSRTLEDGYTLKTRNCFFDDDSDFSDAEMDTRSEEFASLKVIAEQDGKEEVQKNLKNDASDDKLQVAVPIEKQKNETLTKLSRFFNSKSSEGHHGKPPHRPARLSSVSPAPPPSLTRSQSEVQLKKAPKQVSRQLSTTTSSPFIKMCLSNPIGQVLLKNVKQLRSFEFRTPRALTSK